VLAGGKILSLFEPHTQIIARHKVGKPVGFGRKVWLEEVEGGIVKICKKLLLQHCREACQAKLLVHSLSKNAAVSPPVPARAPNDIPKLVPRLTNAVVFQSQKSMADTSVC
jgi:hypothetical protein